MPRVYIFRTCALPPSRATLNSGRLSAKSTASAALIVLGERIIAAAHPTETDAERMLRAPHLASSGPFHSPDRPIDCPIRSRGSNVEVSPPSELVLLFLPRESVRSRSVHSR